jgi:valyl-tRNA synthetase
MSQFNLPPAYEPWPVEEKWYKIWEEAGLFHAEEDPARPPYCITIPPPNVTGELHIGHALCYEIQDLLGRLKRMSGCGVLLLPGTDHAGIATQNVVEKQLAKENLTRHDLGREKFLERVWQWRKHYGGTIEKQFRALGFSFDWQRNRFTMDPDYAEAVLEAFVRFYQEGLIYRGHRVINWCPRCHTAISDIEVDDRELEGKLYHIAYPAAEGDEEIVVATTRPETMLGDTGVAVHPTDKRYQNLIGKKLRLPLTDRLIPVVADEHARPEFGSGAVKITPAHDFDDFEVGRRHKLPSVTVINEHGHMTLVDEDLADARKYHGLDRFAAREKILADLEVGGYLRKIEPYALRLSHCDRCRTVLEPRLSLQWFMRMRKEDGELEDISRRALEAVQTGKVRFVPERWGKVYTDWLENIRDWCISRQLWWGHRIPAWYCGNCDHITVAKITPGKCEACGSADLRQEEDVLDTWFSSALWPFATLGWPKPTDDLAYFYPTQMMVTSSQIIFLWVARMVMCGLHFMGDLPFPIVHVNATVMNWEGKRMSKSLGTGVDPLEMTAKYGTDATRFGLISQAGGQEMRFSEERLEAGRNFCNKIWNAARLVLANTAEAGLTPADLADLPVESATARFPERWIMGRLSETIRNTHNDLERLRFDEAARGLQEFFRGEFCDWYLEIAKYELTQDKRRVQTTLAFVLESSLRLLHPFLPYLTEEIWQHLPHEGNFIMSAPYPTSLPPADDKAEADMARLMGLVTTVRRMRAERKMPPKDWAKVEIITEDEALVAWLKQVGELLAALTRSKIELVKTATLPGPSDRVGGADLETAKAHTAGGEISITGEIYISREVDAVGLKSELARLHKALAAAQTEIARTDKNLANEEFVARAPAEVLEKTRARREQAQAEIVSLQEAIARLEKQIG